MRHNFRLYLEYFEVVNLLVAIDLTVFGKKAVSN